MSSTIVDKSSKSSLLSQNDVDRFRNIVFDYFKMHYRDLPWRNTYNPYHILVSEIMLQQTQVERVIEKYPLFIGTFPDFSSLSAAPVKDVITAWQGLGYNRRALFLIKLSQIVEEQYKGTLPADKKMLLALPGIGSATAGSILAFAFLQPVVFIETNIRRVFIHHFFQDREVVHDAEILPLVEQTLDRSQPREWYYALMDYGSMLRKTIDNPNRKSACYTRQSPFENSDRKLRGEILKLFIAEPHQTEDDFALIFGGNYQRVQKILLSLTSEGFLVKSGDRYFLN